MRSCNNEVGVDSSTKDDYLKKKLCANRGPIENEENNIEKEGKFKLESDKEVATSDDSLRKHHHAAHPNANISEKSLQSQKLPESHDDSKANKYQEKESKEVHS